MSSVKRVVLQRGAAGFGFSLRNERPCVISYVLPDSAAAQAQLHSGDLLLSLNGYDVTNVPLDEVSSLISTMPSLELVLLACGVQLSQSPGIIYPDATQCHSTAPSSPLFLLNSAVSHHKRSAIVRRIGKLTFDQHLEIQHTLLIRRLLPLKQKADLTSKDDCPSDTCCLFEVFSDCLRIRLASRSLEYSSSDLLFAGTIEDDRRFFYLLVRGRHRFPLGGGDIATRSAMDSRSTLCYLFRCLPPKLLGHRGHAEVRERFGVTCHRDKLTGECAEFPRTVVPLVTDLLQIVNRTLLPQINPAESAIQSGLSAPSGTVDTGPDASRNILIDRSTGIASFSTTVTPCTTFKRPVTPSRTSSVHLFGKFVKAASSLKVRWNDKWNSSFQSPMTPYTRNPKSTTKSNLQHSLSTTIATPSCVSTAVSFCASPIGLPKHNGGRRSTSSLSMKSQNSTIPSTSETPWYTDFDSLLADPRGLKHFEAFLTSEFSAENIQFWSEARRWRTEYPMMNAKEECLRIFSNFLDPCSPNAVNVDDAAVKQATIQLDCPSKDMFSEAENQVYQLMKTDSFPRFLISSWCTGLLSAGAGTPNDDELHPKSAAKNKRKSTRSPKLDHLSPAAHRISLDTTTLSGGTPLRKPSVPLRSDTMKGSVKANVSSFSKDFRTRVLRDRSNLQC